MKLEIQKWGRGAISESQRPQQPLTLCLGTKSIVTLGLTPFMVSRWLRATMGRLSCPFTRERLTSCSSTVHSSPCAFWNHHCKRDARPQDQSGPAYGHRSLAENRYALGEVRGRLLGRSASIPSMGGKFGSHK